MLTLPTLIYWYAAVYPHEFTQTAWQTVGYTLQKEMSERTGQSPCWHFVLVVRGIIIGLLETHAHKHPELQHRGSVFRVQFQESGKSLMIWKWFPFLLWSHRSENCFWLVLIILPSWLTPPFFSRGSCHIRILFSACWFSSEGRRKGKRSKRKMLKARTACINFAGAAINPGRMVVEQTTPWWHNILLVNNKHLAHKGMMLKGCIKQNESRSSLHSVHS